MKPDDATRNLLVRAYHIHKHRIVERLLAEDRQEHEMQDREFQGPYAETPVVLTDAQCLAFDETGGI